MTTTAATPPSPTRPPPCVGPDGRAPPGWTFALYYRRSRTERWQEVYRHDDAEELWQWSLEMPSGHYREVMVRTHLFDSCERGGR